MLCPKWKMWCSCSHQITSSARSTGTNSIIVKMNVFPLEQQNIGRDEAKTQSIDPGIYIVNIRMLVAPQSCFRCCDLHVQLRGCSWCWWCGVVTSGPTAPQHTSKHIWHLVHLSYGKPLYRVAFFSECRSACLSSS